MSIASCRRVPPRTSSKLSTSSSAVTPCAGITSRLARSAARSAPVTAGKDEPVVLGSGAAPGRGRLERRNVGRGEAHRIGACACESNLRGIDHRRGIAPASQCNSTCAAVRLGGVDQSQQNSAEECCDDPAIEFANISFRPLPRTRASCAAAPRKASPVSRFSLRQSGRRVCHPSGFPVPSPENACPTVCPAEFG